MNTATSARQVLKLGLTGGIGSGKSTLARMLQSMGADVIDADAVSRATTASGGAAIAAIADAFGQEFIDTDGALDRARMRALVFSQPEQRKVLESIVHPLVGQEIRQQALQATSSVLIFDVPLLVESPHWRVQLDRLLVVDCLPATQVRRVIQRSGWDLATIEAAMRNQCSREQRLAAADCVVFNEGEGLDNLQHLARALAKRFGL
ncbi:dephospho-CoA kinase [Hydrogenophaga sp.]|uniref:dephospho-CoA kinase n=1 Tax=Hydrogenophaga sp. TaxID=1904254 RepID=UPI002ABCC083|nr:dephospho-CoA kinase [Hydrogenophaga sp.]MDZ4281749.1 dephospho-CoA kinase [Hydrogenophaga sp.]MDZ4399519.1 dephospho-CoA kinase [Hydrogenophaga sp.]